MSDWFDEQSADIPELAQYSGDASGNTGIGAPPQAAPAPTQAAPAGGADTNWLNWINSTYGPSASRGSGFADLPKGTSLQDAIGQYDQATGAKAQYLGGPSGDQVNFGQGAVDALTSGGQLWYDYGSPGSVDPSKNRPAAQSGGVPSRAPSGGVGGAPMGNLGSPGGGGNYAAPGYTPFQGNGPIATPQPFGQFNNDAYLAANPDVAKWVASTPGATGEQHYLAAGQAEGRAAPQNFSTLQNAQQQSYNPAAAPNPLQAQQVGTPSALNYQQQAAPAQLSYNAQSTPTAFQGSRQADPGTLNYQNLSTPAGYQAQQFNGLTADQLKADPSYQFRFDQGQQAEQNILAHSGALRSGNAAKALIDYGQGAASQEYAAANARAQSANAQNNAQNLGAYQTNAQTGLAYNQNTNANALNFGQTNITNAANANDANYGRAANEAQQGFSNAFNVNQANNQGQNAATQANITNTANATQANNANALGFGQANIGNVLNTAQANNASNLAYGGQNFNQGFAVNQANNQGQNAAIGANNAANLATQGQQYGQAANTYAMNTGNQFNVAQANQGNALASYQANTQAGLGYGNLGLGYGNLALGNLQANNAYSLGQGQLGLGYGNLGLAQNAQAFNQADQTYQNNYRATVTDPWNQQYQLANLGNPGAPNTSNYANQGSDLYTQQGNANAAGQVGSANAWANGANNAVNAAVGAYGAYQQGRNPAPYGYNPVTGRPSQAPS